jgi:hypothetical protein
MSEKIGRNDPCPCGSGKKYKNCHYGKEIKKTYTSSGKRKFKATVIKMTDEKSREIFQSSTPTPVSPSEMPTMESLKVRMAKTDYRVKKQDTPEYDLPFSIPSHEDGTETEKPTETEPKQNLEEEFKPSTEDFRKKKEE